MILLRPTLLAIILLYSSIINAQLSDVEPVTLKELNLKACPFDPDAGAMIFFNRGNIKIFSTGATTRYSRQIRIKFFTKEHIQEWANHSFLLARGEQNLNRIKATTYNLNGNTIESTTLTDDAIFKKRYDKDTKEVTFTLPNVREGSVIDIEYAYTLDGVNLPRWLFQSTLPTQESRYEVIAPKELEYTTQIQGILKLSAQNKDEQKFLSYWAMYRVPAFKEEPYMASIEDFVSSIEFFPKSTKGGWSDILFDLNTRSDFGDLINYVYDDALFRASKKITEGLTNDLDKFNAIATYVKTNIAWDGEVDKFGDQLPRQTLSKKTGTSADMNFLLLALLREAKIKAAPVLISTRGNGLPNPNRPSLRNFNNMIIHVTLNNKVFLVDATDKYLNSLILPERCMNAAGFVVYRDSAKWIPITSNKSRSIINTKLILSEDGSLSGDVTLTLDGHRASELRKRYVDAGSEFVREWAQELNVEITDLSVENLDNINESFKIKYKTIATNKGQLSANIMYLDPFVQGKTEDNPFKESIRQYPVDFPSTIDRYYIANIEVPESFQIDELPKTVTLTLPDNGGRFLYSVTLNGKMLNITCQISRNKRVFTLNEYKLLQEFYSQIVTKQSELIVLKKK